MLVSGGRVASAITSQLSKPTIDTASGTTMPRSRSASAAPRAIWSLPQKIASGGAAPPLEKLGHRFATPAFRPDAGQIEVHLSRRRRRAPAPCGSRRGGA